MGFYINLDVKFNKVSQELWLDTFNEVISFVNKTPLGYRKHFNYGNEQFLVYSKPEILKNNKGFEYICLSADLNRLTHCGQFELYSNKNAYTLTDDALETEYNVWKSKTQRFSYHKYILATGMLIEHKLKGIAYVSGDITEEEINVAKDILKDTLNLDVDTPERFKGDGSVNQIFALMSMFGASVGDFIAEKSDCLDFGQHIYNTLIDGVRSDLHTFSDEELRTIILSASTHYNFTWSKEVLDSIINTSNRDLLLGYAGIVTVDCRNRDAFEYVSRFFKDREVYTSYLEILNTHKPSSSYILK